MGNTRSIQASTDETQRRGRTVKNRARWLPLCTAAVLAACALPAYGEFALAPEVPVERLLKNVAAYVKENPRDPQGYYLLGRINALAFDRRTRTLRAREEPKPTRPTLPGLDPYQGRSKTGQKTLTEAELRKHLIDAISNYRRAIALKPGNGLCHLGLAWILESGAGYAHMIGAPPGEATPATKPAGKELKELEALVAALADKEHKVHQAAQEKLQTMMPAAVGVLLKHADDKDVEVKSRISALLSGYWREKAIAQYLRAYQLAIKTDLEITRRPLRGLSSLVSYEAGRSWMRLIKQRGETEAEHKRLAEVQKDLQVLDAKPGGARTPIIFSLRPHAGLQDLLAKNKTVSFDLDGTGRPQRWQWVRPDTGILVWDPLGRGRITSGRQLFGSVTWWMFWTDGYHAMDALDDNRDGWLSGAELKGLSVWFDRDTDGVCDPGEVVKLEALGVVALATKSVGRAGESPYNSAGLRLRGGKTLPTYDWVAKRGQVAPAPRASD